MSQDTQETFTGSNAIDLEDITVIGEGEPILGFVDAGADDGERLYRFTLDEARTVTFELTGQHDDADLYLLDSEGCVIWHSTNDWTADELVEDGGQDTQETFTGSNAIDLEDITVIGEGEPILGLRRCRRGRRRTLVQIHAG